MKITDVIAAIIIVAMVYDLGFRGGIRWAMKTLTEIMEDEEE